MARDQNYIGSYRLLKMVRASSACQIWEVMDEIDNRRCALKVLQEDQRLNKEQMALLKHEFVVGEGLNHQNVIDIYDYKLVKGIPFVAMEFFKSSNLKQWLRAVSQSDEELEPKLPGIIVQAAAGLQHLHEHGWTHRDIKPDNFLVSDQLQIKLIDFAIAEKQKKSFAKLLAGRSKVQGTRSYMSPEQIRGASVDHRSDIYSFGCVLYEMFGGRPPFTGGNADQLLQKHLTAPIPSLSAANGKVGIQFAQLVAKMMSKKADQRPGSMSEVSEEVQKTRTSRTLSRAHDN